MEKSWLINAQFVWYLEYISMLMRCLPFSRGVPQHQGALGLGPSPSRCLPTQEAPGISPLSLLSSIVPLKLLTDPCCLFFSSHKYPLHWEDQPGPGKAVCLQGYVLPLTQVWLCSSVVGEGCGVVVVSSLQKPPALGYDLLTNEEARPGPAYWYAMLQPCSYSTLGDGWGEAPDPHLHGA